MIVHIRLLREGFKPIQGRHDERPMISIVTYRVCWKDCPNIRNQAAMFADFGDLVGKYQLGKRTVAWRATSR